MSLNKASRRFGMIATLLALSITSFLVSDANAQTQYCECHDAYDTVAVRSVPVRRTPVRRYRKAAKRTTVARRSVKVVRPAYAAAYVPVLTVEYEPQYTEHVDEDCDDVEYSGARRIIVTERVRPVTESVYYISGIKRNGYYSDGHSKARVRIDGRYSNLDVDSDYYSTTRIASDYGYQDGWVDGKDAGMERDTYHPQNSGDFQKATNGYEDDFGSKQIYRQAYRSAYLKGYNAGFRSVAQSSTYRASRW